MSSNRPVKIAVLGSINLDVVLNCKELPGPGATIFAEFTSEYYGGKGANQAIAAAKLGGEVSMIGRVGDDNRADRLLNNLGSFGVDCRAVWQTNETESGFAIVIVDHQGENAIVVSPGANAKLTPADVAKARDVIAESELLLVQCEIPIDAVVAAIELAQKAGVKVLLDPAPTPVGITQEHLARLLSVDLICPNEIEAATLIGVNHAGDLLDNDTTLRLETSQENARALQRRGANQVIITCGERGAILCQNNEVEILPAPKIQAIDTTGAGDAFAGALAVQWCRTADLSASIRFANAAGALTATHEGANSVELTRERVEALLHEQ